MVNQISNLKNTIVSNTIMTIRIVFTLHEQCRIYKKNYYDARQIKYLRSSMTSQRQF